MSRVLTPLLLGLIIGAVLVLTLCRPAPPPVVVFDPGAAADSGYVPAQVVKPEHMPVIKPVTGTVPVIAGSGYVVKPDTLEQWPDTLDVDVSVVVAPDGHWWAGVWIEGLPVTWHKLNMTQPQTRRRNWQAVVEVAAVSDQPDIGVGVAWTPIRAAGFSGGLSATVDLNRVIDTAPDWFAVSGHVSRRYGPVHVGGHVGYRFGQDAGLHLGVCVGVGLDL